ncbi:MAG: thioredoxin domain-containing protein [Elusimicrobia bacterium]|nr:thioredoxin domain-containing protein [Elusimicrobiota bacterium]
MPCPNCGRESAPGAGECPNCGIIFAKWKPHDVSSPVPAQAEAPAGGLPWGTALLIAALAAGGWYGYRASHGAGGAPAAGVEGPASEAGGVVELTDAGFADFVARDKSPALVAFYRTACPYCQSSMPALDRLSLASRGRYRIGKLDVEAQTALADRFSVRGVPTFLFFSRGQPAGSITGAPAEDEEGIYQGLRSFIDEGLGGT